MPVLERKMDDENSDGLQISLDDQPFYPLLEIMKTKILNALLGQQSIALLFQDRNLLGERAIVILTFNDVIIAQFFGDCVRLTEISAAVGAGIDLDQRDDVGINSSDKTDYSLQIDRGFFKKTSERQW